MRTPWHSPSSPAVANEGKKLHLFWRNESNVLVMASLSGSHWSDSTPVGGTSSVSGGLTTHVAPAAHYFNGDVNVFIVASTGQILYKRLSKPNWLFVDKVRLMDQSPIAVTVSHGKLFIFAQQGGVTYYKLRERERADRVTLLPVDQWLPVENGRARTSVAAVSFNDSVYLFYGANHASAFLPGLAAQLSPYVFMQSATWSTARIAILPLAKSDCSNGASTADFPGLIEFADSVYSPHMIRVILGHIHPHECNDLIWDLANQFIKPGDDKSGRNDKFFTTLDNIADREIFDNQILIFVTNESGGGGFSGYSIEYVYHPDQVINVCNAVGVGSTSPYRNGFAHEIGHLAGLPHTFAGVVPDGGNNRIAYTHAEVQTAFDKANYDLSIFDGDLVSFIPGFGVNDTPPDPLYEQNGVSDMKCSPVETPISLLDGRTVPPVQVDLVPPRLNLMSYYQISPKLVHRLSRDQVKVVYQGLRSKGVIE